MIAVFSIPLSRSKRRRFFSNRCVRRAFFAILKIEAPLPLITAIEQETGR